MTNLKTQFGRKLKVLRKQANLTQNQLAEQTELTVESISNIERGIHGPKFETLEKLTKVLNIEAEELFDFK